MESTPSRTGMTRRLGSVQALRAAAALAVAVYHIGTIEPRLAGGYSLAAHLGNLGALGVYVFFVISGFIMITTNWTEFAQRLAPKRFLLRRIVRIVPPYWIVTTLLLLLYLKAPSLINQGSRYPTSVIDSYLLLPQRGYALLMVGWTLVFEMYFYYIFTAALALARKYFAGIILVWLCAMIALRELVYPYHKDNMYLWLASNPANLYFISGILVGYLVMNGRVFAPRFCAIAGIIVLPLFYYTSIGRIPVDVPLGEWLGVLRIAFPAALMLYGIVTMEIGGMLRVAPIAVLVGDASYALYLWHVPILSALGRLSARLPLHPLALHVLWCVIALAIAVYFSVLVYRFVERPILKTLESVLGLRQHSVTVPPAARAAAAEAT